MTIQIDHAQSDDAPAVVTMIDELLHEIMAE